MSDDFASSPAIGLLGSPVFDFKEPQPKAAPWAHCQTTPLYRIATKRVFDVAVSLFLIILLLPLMALISAAIFWQGGNVLFFQKRMGAEGINFRCFKFRTMVPNAEARLAAYLSSDPELQQQWQLHCKLKHDPRITFLGRFLRKTSLDELPQLFNVLVGDMSLIGPRPIKAEEISRYANRYHDYCRCRPGLTGLWQVYRNDGVDYVRRTELDSLYVAHWSFRRDLVILWKTVPVVLLARGAC